MLLVSLLWGLKINFELVKTFIYFWLWSNTMLTQVLEGQSVGRNVNSHLFLGNINLSSLPKWKQGQ